MSEMKKVLVCEDNVLMQRLLQFTLESIGLEVIVADDGEEGIRFLKEQPVQLLITDINMPYNNGLELIQFVRKNFGKKIPVIIISNINLEETKKHAQELGADRYITKPFDPKQLVEIIQSLNITV